MGHIFISYSHKDTKYAHKLADSLQGMGLDIWIDERLDYGSQWPHEIQKQLDSCDAFILIMSPRSFASEWVQSELQRAKRKLKPVFPLLLEGDEPWLSVESTQYYDVRDNRLPDAKFYSALKRVTPVSQSAKTFTQPSDSFVKTGSQRKVRPGIRPGIFLAGLGGLGVVLIVSVVAIIPSISRFLNPQPDSPTSTMTVAPIFTQAAINDPTLTSSNDHEKIAFVSTKDETRGLYLLDVQDKSVTPIATDLTGGLSGGVTFKWSPDGKFLAYTAFLPKRGIYIVNENNLQSDLVFETSLIFAFDWSPASDKIVIGSKQDSAAQAGSVFIIDSGTKVFEFLTDLQVDLSGFAEAISWSPDNSVIALSVTDDDSGKLKIYWIDPDGTNSRKIIDQNGNSDNSSFVTYYLDWSPDGKSLAVMTENEIMVISRDGSAKVLYSNPGGFDTILNSVAWSPDNTKLVFDDVSNTIRIMDISDASITELPLKGRCANWSPDGKNIIFTATGPNYAEIYLTNDSGMEKLTNDMQVECAMWQPGIRGK